MRIRDSTRSSLTLKLVHQQTCSAKLKFLSNDTLVPIYLIPNNISILGDFTVPRTYLRIECTSNLEFPVTARKLNLILSVA